MDVRLPNGKIIRGVPDGTPKDEVMAKAISAGLIEPTEAPEAPSGFMRGMRDPLDAAAQMLAKVVPEGVEQSVNQFNNWLVDKGAPLERLPAGGLDEQLSQQERAYQQQRRAAGETGMDWPRLGGNIASPVNLLAASKIPQAYMKARPLATSAVAGAGLGMLQPVYEGDFAEEKAKQAAFGGVAGPLTQKAVSGLSRVVRPQTNPEVQTLMREGVTPTPGQIMGGSINRYEQKAMSMPLLGDAITSARQGNIKDLNRAVYNRALSPIGEEFPKNMDVGRRGVAYVNQKLSDAYEEVLPKLTGMLDDQFRAELDSLNGMVSTLPKDRADQFGRILNREVFERFKDSGRASGETLKAIESKLSQLAKQYKSAVDGDQRQLGQAIEEAQSSLRSMLSRHNPEFADRLQAINKGYANYSVIRDAASRRGSKEGIITPASLAGASRASDRTVGKGGTAKGRALLQDLSDPAENVLATQFPNSGTTDRLLANSLALGGLGYMQPGAIAGLGAASLPYLGIGRKAMAGLLTSRPQIAEPAAERMRALIPYLMPGTTQGGLLGN